MSRSRCIIYPQNDFLERSRSGRTWQFSGRLSWNIRRWQLYSRARSGQRFLLFISRNTQCKTNCQSPLAVQIRTGASGDHALPWQQPKLALQLKTRVECSYPRAKPVAARAQKAVGRTSACGSFLSYHKEKWNVTVSTGSNRQEWRWFVWAWILVQPRIWTWGWNMECAKKASLGFLRWN